MTRSVLPSPAPRSLLSVWLAACVVAIVYVSLHPWRGWQMPTVSPFAFLSEPWPRYWTWLDLLLNFVAYLPLGALGAAWLARRLPVPPAVLVAGAGAALLSCGLEALQAFLPTRIPSLGDLLANTAGAITGSATVAAIGPARIGAAFRSLTRAGPVAPGSGSGLLLLAFWVALQWHPRPIAFSSGEVAPLLGTLAPGAQAWLAALRLSVDSQPLAEAVAVAATTLGVGLLTRELLRPGVNWAVALPMLLAAAMKASATASLLGAGRALAWLTAGAQGGLLAGGLLLALSLWWRPRPRLLTAIVAIGCATTLHNLSPTNVYFQSSMAAWDQGQWANVNGLLRALAIVWPFAAIGWCIARLRRHG